MRYGVIGVVLVVAGVMVTPAVAHHGAATFDTGKEITLKGVVTEWIWANPHCFLKFDAKDETAPCGTGRWRRRIPFDDGAGLVEGRIQGRRRGDGEAGTREERRACRPNPERPAAERPDAGCGRTPARGARSSAVNSRTRAT